MSPESGRAVTLMPGDLQGNWRAPAAANFALGGLGAGLYAAAVLASGFGPTTALGTASWLGPALVLAGFAVVATEAGRPLRGPRVLARPGTSWMSREAAVGSAFVALALGEFLVPAPALRVGALAAALTLALAQGAILKHARGVPAWSVAPMPLAFLVSALLSGASLLILLETAAGSGPRPLLLGGTLGLLAVGLGVWRATIAWSADEAFVHSVRPLRGGRAAVAIVAGGYLVPILLLAVALGQPAWASPAVALGALLALGGQVYAKAMLVLAAGRLRPITIPHLGLQRRLS